MEDYSSSYSSENKPGMNGLATKQSLTQWSKRGIDEVGLLAENSLPVRKYQDFRDSHSVRKNAAETHYFLPALRA